MTREELKQILESDKEQSKIITEILNTVNQEKEALKSQKDIESKYLKLKEEFDGLKNESKDTEALQEQIQTLTTKNADLEKSLNNLKLTHAIDLEVANSGLKNAKFAGLITKSLDLDKISFNEEGKLTGLDEQIQAFREDKDISVLFRDETPQRQAYAPPKGDESTKKETQGAMLAAMFKGQVNKE